MIDNHKTKKIVSTDLGDENKKLKEELQKAKKELEEYKNKYLRALADYQNYEKRVAGEKQEITKIANSQLLLKLLPILDNLDKAEVFIKDNGLRMVKDNFYRVLKELGIEEIEILRKEFNPQLAEAIDVVDGDKDNIVVEVLRKGYKLNNTVLRVAQVKVSKKVNS